MFAVTIVARFHELNHAATQTASGSAHHQTERAGSFALTVSGVDHEEPAGAFLVVFAAPFVTFFFHAIENKWTGTEPVQKKKLSCVLGYRFLERVFGDVVQSVGALDCFLQQTNDHRLGFFPAATQRTTGRIAMTTAAKLLGDFRDVHVTL